jgi:hypothetical protein
LKDIHLHWLELKDRILKIWNFYHFWKLETHKSINFYIFKVGAIPKSSGEQIPIGHFVAVFVENVWILGEVKVWYINKNFVENIKD